MRLSRSTADNDIWKEVSVKPLETTVESLFKVCKLCILYYINVKYIMM